MITLAPRVASPSYGGVFTPHQPRIIVAHSTESNMRTQRGTDAAHAVALYLSRREDGSVHYVLGPTVIVPMVPESNISWGAGDVNPAAIHVEFCGRAAFTRAQWTTPDGLSMLKLGGALFADIAGRRGIPLRWLTDSELLAAWKGLGPGGLTTHDQCRRVIGGTTHHDPGDGFPKDLLLEYATQGDDDMKADDKLTFRDAYLGAKNPKDVDQTLTVAQGIQRAYNYGSVALRDLGQMSAEISKLRAEIAALKKGTVK